MERVARLSKNAAALVGAKLATSGLSFLMAIILNKELGPVKVGIYNYAFVLYTIFQVIPDFGIGYISIRDVSQDNSKLHYYFRNIVGLRLLLGFGAFILLMATNLITTALQGPGALTAEKFWVVFTIAFCLLIEQPFSNTLAENFIALERLTAVALVYLILGVMKVALSIYVVLAGYNHVLVLLILVYIFTYLYSIIHFYIIYRRLLGRESRLTSGSWDKALAEAVTHAPESPSEAVYEALVADFSYADLTRTAETEPGLEGVPTPASTPDADSPAEEAKTSSSGTGDRKYNREFWLYLLRSAWPLAVVSGGVIIYAVLDIPILSWIKGDKEVGLYSAAAMFAKALVLFTLAINMAILPAVSKVYNKFPERLGIIWERLLYYALALTVPLVVITPVLARPFLILEEHDFITAWHAVWLTMAAMNFSFITAISFPFFVVINKQKKITVVVSTGLAIKVVLDFIAIPIWGYMGAAMVMVFSEFAVFALICIALSRELRYRINVVRFAGAPLISLVVLYLSAFVLNKLFITGKDTVASSVQAAFIVTIISSILYLAFAKASGILKKSKLRELNEWLTVD